jgi:hypothetical protein
VHPHFGVCGWSAWQAALCDIVTTSSRSLSVLDAAGGVFLTAEQLTWHKRICSW